MPFLLIPFTLAASFLLVWAFIGAMILRDAQLATRCEREFEGGVLPLRSYRRDPAHTGAEKPQQRPRTTRPQRQKSHFNARAAS